MHREDDRGAIRQILHNRQQQANSRGQIINFVVLPAELVALMYDIWYCLVC